MTQGEFLKCLSEKTPYTVKEIEFLMNIFSEIVQENLKTDDHVRTPLGIFKKIKLNSHRVRDISSGEIKIIPEHEKVVFLPNPKIRNSIDS